MNIDEDFDELSEFLQGTMFENETDDIDNFYCVENDCFLDDQRKLQQCLAWFKH